MQVAKYLQQKTQTQSNYLAQMDKMIISYNNLRNSLEYAT